MDVLYPPKTDPGWITWGENFVKIAVAAGAELGLAPAQVAAAQEAMGALKQAYMIAHSVERSMVTVQRKNTALDVFREMIKPLVAVVQANRNVSDTQRVELGLKVRRSNLRRAVAPAVAPRVMASLLGPQQMRVLASDPQVERGGTKPHGCVQIALHVQRVPDSAPHASAALPGAVSNWPLERLSGRTRMDLYLPDLAEVTTVWVSCCYLNTRGVRGPFSAPVSVRLPGNGRGAATTRTGASPTAPTGPGGSPTAATTDAPKRAA